MNKLKYYLLTVTMMVMASCKLITNYDKLHLKLSDSSPYSLEITSFSWGYVVTGINQFNGDFDKLDEKVYDLLKGKTGTCRVNLQGTGKDKYGNPDASMLYIGDISIDELNKYQDWKYWQKDGGIRKLLYSYINKPSPDITNVDTIKNVQSSQTNSQPLAEKTRNNVKVYSFTINMLYPMESDRANLDPNNYNVDGTIIDANFTAGAMRIQTEDGEQIDVQFYPLDASSAVQNDLRLALEAGNKISSICARAGASTMDLVSAQIMEP